MYLKCLSDWDKISVWFKLSWNYVDQPGLELRDTPASQNLGLKMGATTPIENDAFYNLIVYAEPTMSSSLQ